VRSAPASATPDGDASRCWAERALLMHPVCNKRPGATMPLKNTIPRQIVYLTLALVALVAVLEAFAYWGF
jgi:hypothetical protein